MIPQEIQNRGIVVSFTTLRKPPEGFEPPLTLALVELKHGAHVLCLLADETDLSKVEIGKDAILSIDDQNRLRFVPS
jgi:uncharacterized OB-fold protein